MKNIIVPTWLSTRAYNFGTPSSRAYISNEMTKELILLDGEASDLWNVILESKNLNEILDYVRSKKLEEELDDFLCELKESNLIISEEDVSNHINPKVSAILPPFEEETEFMDDMTSWQFKQGFLSNLLIELTYKCNENCIHCFNHKNLNKYEIKFEDIKPVIDNAFELGVFCITLSGGECTLAKDFLKIAKYIREKRISLAIFTNGQTLYDNPDLFEELVKLYPSRIGLSLYSMKPEIHDEITRVKGSQEKTLAVIKKLKGYNIRTELKCFLTKYNADTYQNVVQFAKENDINCTLDEAFLYNKENNNSYVQITEKQLIDFYSSKFVNSISFKKDKTFVENQDLNNTLCGAGHSFLAINPKLEIYPCSCYEFILGNLNNKSLKEIWLDKNPDTHIIKCRQVKKKDLKECYKEDYCVYCKYCPGKALSEGNYLGKSEILCKLAKIKMKVFKNYRDN